MRRRGVAALACFVLVALVAVCRGQTIPGSGRPESELVRPAPGTSTTMPITGLGEPEVLQSERFSLPPPTSVPLEGPIDPQTYVCGRGDAFDLNFWGKQNFKLRVTADLEGRTFIPKVGFVSIVGKNLAETRRIIKAAIERYYPGLNVDVALAVPRTFGVHVVDHVGKPGLYQATALQRVAAIISAAGSVSGSRRRIEIKRRDGSTLIADLVLYELTGDNKYNPTLLDGDIIRVPPEGLTVLASGALRRTGRFELVATRDLHELISIAGGLRDSVTSELPIRIIRRDAKDRERQIKISFERNHVPAEPLQSEDQVFIPSLSEVQRGIFVSGAIVGANPSDSVTAVKLLPYFDGDSVRTVLERAGGVGTNADLKTSFLRHADPKLPVEPLDLEALLIRRDFSADRPVKLDDTIMVPYARQSVLVEGAVQRQGVQQYKPSYGMREYVALAGGPTRLAKGLGSYQLLKPTGETKAYSKSLVVAPGDTITVPEVTFTRSEIVQLVVTSFGIAISVATVAILLR